MVSKYNRGRILSGYIATLLYYSEIFLEYFLNILVLYMGTYRTLFFNFWPIILSPTYNLTFRLHYGSKLPIVSNSKLYNLTILKSQNEYLSPNAQ